MPGERPSRRARRINLILVTAGIAILAVIPAARSAVLGDYADNFQTADYTGNTGSLTWTTAWQEFGEGDGPGDGSAEVDNEAHCASDQCLVLGKDNNADAGVWREADLTGATSATLTFTYKRHRHGSGLGFVQLSVSGNGGGTWSNLKAYQLSTEDSGQVLETIDLSPWISATTRIKFELVNSLTDDAHMNVDDLDITLVVTNFAPELDPIGNRVVDETTQLAFTAAASDPDAGDSLTFSLAGGPPPGAAITSGGNFTWTPTEAQGPGTYTFDVVVTDNGSPVMSDRETIAVTVNDVNLAPVLAPIGNKTIAEKQKLGFTATASDPDPTDSLSYSLSGGAPAGASITPGGLFAWTPTEAQGPGSYSFDVIVADSGTPTLSDKEQITVTVTEVNTAPTITDPGKQSSAVNAKITLPVTATDPDQPANSLSYAATGLPPGLTINSISGIITGTISSGAAGGSPYTVRVTVTDNGAPARNDTATFTWTITATNRAPTLKPPGVRSIGELSRLAFVVSASDPDTTDSLSFSLSGSVPAGASITSGGLFAWTPTEAQGPGTYSFDVIVSDGALSDKEKITVTVTEVNAAPTITDPGDQSSAVNADVALPIGATDPDQPANSLSYTAAGLPPGLTISPTSGIITGTMGSEAADGSPHTVEITATDNGTPTRFDTTTFTWTITTTNEAPTGAAMTVETLEDTAVGFTPPVDDADGHSLTIEVVSGPNHGTVTGDGVELRYTPDPEFFGTDAFTYRASDGLATSPPYVVTFVVEEVNDSPVAAPDRYDITAGATLTADLPGVLGNDTDEDDDPLTTSVAARPRHGTLLLRPDGSFVYEAAPDFAGTDTFTYFVTDPSGATASGEVSIIVTAPASSATRTLVTDQVIDRGPDDPPPDVAAAGIQRSLVVMDRASRAAIGEVGFPLVLLIAALAAALSFGRIGLVPLFSRGERHTGVVRLYEPEAGFGLVVREADGGEVFFHRSAIPRWRRRKVHAGAEVEFRSIPGPYRDFVTMLRPAT